MSFATPTDTVPDHHTMRSRQAHPHLTSQNVSKRPLLLACMDPWCSRFRSRFATTTRVSLFDSKGEVALTNQKSCVRNVGVRGPSTCATTSPVRSWQNATSAAIADTVWAKRRVERGEAAQGQRISTMTILSLGKGGYTTRQRCR